MKFLAATLAAFGLLANAQNGEVNRPKDHDSKIAVVGGGIAGIYSAYKLSKLGYKEITVFEKSARLGGKAQSLRMSGHHIDLGTLHWLSASYDWIFATAEELNLPMYGYVFEDTFFDVYYAQIPLPAEMHEAFGESMTFIDFLRHPVLKGEEQMLAKLDIYRAKYNEYFTFSSDQYDFPDLTTDAQMAVLGNMTYAEWFVQNDLMDLYPLGFFCTVFFLYGFPETLTAYHSLYLAHPGIMEMVITRNYATYLPYAGYQGFVETMALDQQLHVIYNANIQKIVRKNANSNQCPNGGCVSITYKTKAMGEPATEKFDFLVNAIHPMYYNKKAFKVTNKESRFFDPKRWETNRLTLNVGHPNEKNRDSNMHKRPYTRYSEGQLKGLHTKYDVILCLNRKIFIPQGQLVRNDTGSGADCATHTAWNYDKRMPDWLNCYTEKFNVPLTQEGQSNGVSDNEEWNPEVATDLDFVTMDDKDLHMEPRDIQYQHEREYLNRYNFENTAAAYPTKLFRYNLENNRNTWFVGSYVSFENMGRIADQIELLLERSGVKEKVVERPNFKDKFFAGPIMNLAPGHDGLH